MHPTKKETAMKAVSPLSEMPISPVCLFADRPPAATPVLYPSLLPLHFQGEHIKAYIHIAVQGHFGVLNLKIELCFTAVFVL